MVFSVNRWLYLPISFGTSVTVAVAGIVLIYFIQGQTAGPQVNSNFPDSISDNGLTDTGWFTDNEIVFVELTASVASRALKGFSLYRERFSPVAPNLQNNNDKLIGNTSRAEVFLNDLKRLGFDSLEAWRSVLATIAYTHSSMANSEGNILIENSTSSTNNRVSLDGNQVSEGNRKIVAELLRNAVDRALLEDLVGLDE